jgi:hypothetical protein
MVPRIPETPIINASMIAMLSVHAPIFRESVRD